MTLRELLRRYHASPDPPVAPSISPQAQAGAGEPGHGLLNIQTDGRIGIDLRDPGRLHTEVTCELACWCGATLAVDEVDPIGHMATLACLQCGGRQSCRLPATMDLS